MIRKKQDSGKEGDSVGELGSKGEKSDRKAPGDSKEVSKGINNPKSIEDKSLGSVNEKTDSRYTSDKGELAQYHNKAEAKTNISSDELAKMDASEENQKQQVPLEYQGYFGRDKN